MDMPMVPAAKAVRIVRGGGLQVPANPPAAPPTGQCPSPVAAAQPPPGRPPLHLTRSSTCKCRWHLRAGQGNTRQCGSSSTTQSAGPHRQTRYWWRHGQYLRAGPRAHPSTTSSSRRGSSPSSSPWGSPCCRLPTCHTPQQEQGKRQLAIRQGAGPCPHGMWLPSSEPWINTANSGLHRLHKDCFRCPAAAMKL
jgi:hypothetical protein